jgi:hypothetical protein
MKPIAWYDPTNGMVSTDNDCPLFTPLGQIWGLYPKEEWVGLTDEEAQQTFARHNCTISTHLAGILARAIEAKLKEKNT